MDYIHSDPKLHSTVDGIIKDICAKHSTENVEADVVALFEDIIRFFSGREEDFIKFDSMTAEQKEELYREIKTIIDLLRKLNFSEVDRGDALKLLSKDLAASFSKNNLSKAKIKEVLDKKELDRLKEEFAKLSIAQMYKSIQREAAQEAQQTTAALATAAINKKSIESFVERASIKVNAEVTQRRV